MIILRIGKTLVARGLSMTMGRSSTYLGTVKSTRAINSMLHAKKNNRIASHHYNVYRFKYLWNAPYQTYEKEPPKAQLIGKLEDDRCER